MKKIMKTAVLLVLMLALVHICASTAFAETSVGDVCPDFSLTTLSGETFRLSDCRGKVVFINIWATWCPPCVGEMPDIQRLQETYDDLVVLGVSVDDDVRTVRSFVQKNGYTYTMTMDERYTVMGIFPTNYIPYSIFIDPNGVVTYLDSGSMSYDRMESLYLNAKANANSAAKPAAVGDVCPDFSLTTLSGETFRLSDCRGKVVFINMWATWCGPCVAEMPDIQRLSETYGDLMVLGVDVWEDDESTVRSFIQEHGYTYTMTMDEHYTVMEIFPTNAIPHSIFIDPNGVVTYLDSGYMGYDRMESLYRNAKANAKPTAEPTTTPEPTATPDPTATPEPGRVPGDVNGDETVDDRDLLRLARFIAGYNVTIDTAAADMNGDGKIDGRDVLRLTKYLAGI